MQRIQAPKGVVNKLKDGKAGILVGLFLNCETTSHSTVFEVINLRLLH